MDDTATPLTSGAFIARLLSQVNGAAQMPIDDGFDESIDEQTSESRIPPHDLDAEGAVLCALLLESVQHDADFQRRYPRVIESYKRAREILRPEHFYSEAHRRICEAILETPDPDVVTVAAHLRDSGRLAQVGGTPYLTEILNSAPSVANVAHYAEIVVAKYAERQVILGCQEAAAQLYAGVGSAPAIFDALRKRLETSTTAQRPLVEFLEHDDLFVEDEEADLVIPALGIGPGFPTGIFGQGYVGKTIVAMTIGMSVALGVKLWGVHDVKPGVYVHLDHDQGRSVTKQRLRRVAAAMGAGREETRGKLRVAVYPRLALTTPAAIDHYARAFDGARIAAIDALRRVIPGLNENDSEVGDVIGEVLSRASDKTGCAILLLHHAGKTPPDGPRPRKEQGRGSSSIYDACQSVFVITGKKGEPALVTHEKDRYLGREVPNFTLRIEDVPTDDGNLRGGLRVVSSEGPAAAPPATREAEKKAQRAAEREERARQERSRELDRQAAKRATEDQRAAELDAALRRVIARTPGIGSDEARAEVAAELGGCSRDRFAASLARIKLRSLARIEKIARTGALRLYPADGPESPESDPQ